MIPLWFYLGSRIAAPWTWYLTVPALIWVIGFMGIDRMRHRQNTGSPGDSLLQSARDSLTQVSHQIWLLRNVFWWYLLPFIVSISAFFIQVSFQAASHWTEAIGATTLMVGSLLVVYFGIYLLNQYAVRRQLEPRRQELLALLESLAGDSVESAKGEYPILMGAGRDSCSPRRTLIGNILAVLILVIGVPAILYFAVGIGGDDFPKLAPFTDVRWGDSFPEVDVDGKPYFLYAIDDIFVDEIIGYCKLTYPDKWQKRFSEDLVEVLAGMGHKTGDTVRLGLISKPGRTAVEVAIRDAEPGGIREGVEAGDPVEDRAEDNTSESTASFTVERWVNEIPIIAVDGEPYLLLAVNGISVIEIRTYCEENHPGAWQQRFAEDLLGILAGMGHETGDTVQFDGVSMTEMATKVVAMTAANRRAVRRAAEGREAMEERLDQPDEAMKDETMNRGKPDPNAPFEETLEAIRASYKLPAMAAFAMRGGAIIEQATVGTRSAKDDTPVKADAPWHLGSNTKAMTATVAGMLVEEGLLRWDATIGEVLGEAAPDMNGAHRDTTLAMLLHHTGGITPNINWFAAPEDRLKCAAELLGKPPSKKGRYAYSNGGYVVAGAMMEVVTGKRWEDLMRKRLFEPLGMTATGFGAPTEPGAPWGHESGLLAWKPKNPTARNADNAPVLGPAGTVHTTLEDYARFIAAHLKGAQGEDGIVTAETFRTLHTPAEGGDYAMGWIVTERDWAGGRALTHGGSNTLWFATVWIASERDMAFFAVTNAGGNTAFRAVDEAVVALLERHGGRE
ncbi:MAG: serine hydrolase [Candidatus Hydrogenedentes bacterium]|nr:serine hydrolase [Candidatus Hydrogenedentota bacterium]